VPVVITGVTPGGIGAEAAKAIAKQSPKLLILAGRSQDKLNAAAEAIKAVAPDANTQSVVLDLASLASVRAAAAEVRKLTPTVDLLINNAGIMMVEDYRTTADGVELQFGVNYLGHFLLTNLLMPAILTSALRRVVNVTSSGHRGGPVVFDDVNFGGGKTYGAFAAYARSKTANILLGIALRDRLGDKGVVSFGVDPGS
jgi:NAD(P)-dependent dehydrogenase (short-subunit alcohol dehydrogenase family)